MFSVSQAHRVRFHFGLPLCGGDRHASLAADVAFVSSACRFAFLEVGHGVVSSEHFWGLSATHMPRAGARH